MSQCRLWCHVWSSLPTILTFVSSCLCIEQVHEIQRGREPTVWFHGKHTCRDITRKYFTLMFTGCVVCAMLLGYAYQQPYFLLTAKLRSGLLTLALPLSGASPLSLRVCARARACLPVGSAVCACT